jgi:hypothetical protein
MSANLIREIWKVVEGMQSLTLLGLDDRELLEMLLKTLKESQRLDHSETTAASSYLHSRLALVRDLALSRLEEEAPWEALSATV